MWGVWGDVWCGGCEPRVEGIVQGTKRYCTILRKYSVGGGGGGSGEGSSWGGQCGCDRRIEVFGKIHRKKSWGVRGGGGWVGGVGLVGGGGGVRVDVNEELKFL